MCLSCSVLMVKNNIANDTISFGARKLQNKHTLAREQQWQAQPQSLVVAGVAAQPRRASERRCRRRCECARAAQCAPPLLQHTMQQRAARSLARDQCDNQYCARIGSLARSLAAANGARKLAVIAVAAPLQTLLCCVMQRRPLSYCHLLTAVPPT